HAWVARFSLIIPRNADSETAWLTIEAMPLINPETGLGRATFDATVFVGSELYRTFQVTLQVAPADVPLPKQMPTPSIVKDETSYVPTAHLGLHPTQEWTTPPGVLTVMVGDDGRAAVFGDAPGFGTIPGRYVPWTATSATLAARITNVRSSVEKFRSKSQ